MINSQSATRYLRQQTLMQGLGALCVARFQLQPIRDQRERCERPVRARSQYMRDHERRACGCCESFSCEERCSC